MLKENDVEFISVCRDFDISCPKLREKLEMTLAFKPMINELIATMTPVGQDSSLISKDY